MKRVCLYLIMCMVFSKGFGQRLDSTYRLYDVFSKASLEPTGKTIFSYNAKNEVRAEDRYNYDLSTDKWEFVSEKTFTYSPTSLVTEEVTLYPDASQTKRIRGDSSAYEYNLQGNPTRRINYGWDTSTKDWIPYTQDSLEYQNKWNQVSERRSYRFDSTGWTQNGLENRFYGDSNLMDSQVYSFLRDGNWEPSLAYVEHFNSKGELLSWSSYINYGNGLVLRRHREYHYSDNGLLDSTITYDGENKILDELTVFSYDTQGQILSSEVFERSFTKWLEHRKYVRVWNDSNRVSDITTYNFNGGKYTPTQRSTYKYAAHGESWLGITSNWINDAWMKESGFRNFYSIPVGNALLETMELRLYPNPVADVCIIENLPTDAQEADIYNINGKLVERVPIMSSSLLHLSQLPKGSYILVIHASQGILTSRFVKG